MPAMGRSDQAMMGDSSISAGLADDLRAVITEARRRAIEAATEQLADRYADALVAAAWPTTLAPAKEASAAAEKTEHGAWYVYALVAGEGVGAGCDAVGVEEAPVRCVTEGAISALVSLVDVPALQRGFREADMAEDGWLATTATRHDEVVQRAFRSAPTAPIRLGTVVDSLDELRNLLRVRQPQLLAELKRLSQCAEWLVELTECPADLGATPAQQPIATTGSTYLAARGEQRRAAKRTGTQAERVVASVARELSEHCRDLHLPDVESRARPLRAEALVGDDSSVDFVGTLDSLLPVLSQHGWRIECSGPWPAYHFVRPDLLAVADG